MTYIVAVRLCSVIILEVVTRVIITVQNTIEIRMPVKYDS